MYPEIINCAMKNKNEEQDVDDKAHILYFSTEKSIKYNDNNDIV